MSTRIIAAVQEKDADQRPFFSLYLKVAMTLLLAGMVPVLLAIASPEPWFVSSVVGRWILPPLGSSFAIGGFAVHPYYAAIGIIAALCFALVMLDVRALYMRPIAQMRGWVRSIRDGAPAVMPQFAHDEIGLLAREVSALTAAYMKTQENNEDLSKQKSLFTTIMAHQLRTPLTGLMWSVEALLGPDASDEERKKILPDIAVLLKRMRLIVNHILATASVDTGHYGYVMQETDIAALVQQLVADFMPVAKDRGLTLQFDHPQELPPVYADSERISIALFDLVSNAVDYTPVGGAVTVALAPGKDCVSVSVSDTGIGIPSSEMPLIFSKFYRGENARRMRADGSGLGLYLAKEIITSHGSDITVQSSSKGSRFSFYLSTRQMK